MAKENSTRKGGDWTIPVSLDFIEEAAGMTINESLALSDRAYRVLQALEAYARNHENCWPSNETLARLTRKSPETLPRIFRELEAAGYIQRVYTTESKSHRSGFTLARRTHRRLPKGEMIANGVL